MGSRDQDAYSAIATKILRGELAQGERLSEPKLAAELSLSRAPVREALRALERTGMVMSMPNRGAFVARASADQAAEAYVIRQDLEPGAFARALRRPDQMRIAWNAALTDMAAATERNDMPALLEAHGRFHGVAYQARGSRLLSEIWARIDVVNRQYFGPMRLPADQLAAFVGQHRELATELLERDGDNVADLVQQHLHEGVGMLPFPFGSANRAERFHVDLRLPGLVEKD